MSRNLILLISIFILGIISIIGGYWALKSVFSDGVEKESSAQISKNTSKEQKTINRKSQVVEKGTMGPKEGQPIGITEAIGKFEEEQRKDRGTASVYETGRKRFKRLADRAEEGMDGDHRSGGPSSNSVKYKKIIERKAQENKERLRKVEKEGKFHP